MENQHKLIAGYRDLSEKEVNAINEIKSLEAKVAALWQAIRESEFLPDPRWTSIAKTHFEEGFSAMVRSVAKPDSPFDY